MLVYLDTMGGFFKTSHYPPHCLMFMFIYPMLYVPFVMHSTLTSLSPIFIHFILDHDIMSFIYRKLGVTSYLLQSWPL